MTNNTSKNSENSRRDVLTGVAVVAGLAVAAPAFAKPSGKDQPATNSSAGPKVMNTITVKDGTQIFYKDWGKGTPIVFHHGWPLSADDWDSTMLYFLSQGFRVIAYDRRGHGRSSPSPANNDMDTYADDCAALVRHLGLKGAIHVGHSTGGGEVARYVAKHGGSGLVSKAVLMSAITPVMLKSAKNPGGLPIEVFDGIRAGLAANHAQFYRDFASGPFYGYNRPGAKTSQGIVDNWWRQAMMGDVKAHYDCVKTFSETEFTEDLKRIEVPVLVMHGEDDQIVPIASTAPLASKLLRKGILKTYPGFPHGMFATNPETINADLLAFFKS
jgi:non-heme chloroperoxidase